MMTYSAPVSRIIAALISPVNAPSRSQCRFCAAIADVAVARRFGRRVQRGERRRHHDLDSGEVLHDAAELFDVLHGLGHRLVHLPVAAKNGCARLQPTPSSGPQVRSAKDPSFLRPHLLRSTSPANAATPGSV